MNTSTVRPLWEADLDQQHPAPATRRTVSTITDPELEDLYNQRDGLLLLLAVTGGTAA
ncbi:hypothetical protein [Streptomyces sp. NBC_01304]|uniref:hypothetical protein n=1 Tax=Streptomyces sp. NBC_01304 TaxID=2903818 RepID=UPI002E15CBCD|nr:hypothetical protein OG430_48045 [Streptomyces sp. NBC_01304]